MSPILALSPDRLDRSCDADRFAFMTTAELDDLLRAIDAAHFDIGMRHAGCNPYDMGPPGRGKIECPIVLTR